MPGRTSLTQVILLTLFAIGALAAAECVLAECIAPRPVLPLDPDPGDPTTPPADPSDRPEVGTPQAPRPGITTPEGRRPGPRTGGNFGFAGSWRVWWNFNREHILGLRGVTGIEASGAANESAVDPLGRERAKSRDALERIALSGQHQAIRAAALCALGRESSAQNAEIFLKVLAAPHQRHEVLAGAAVGLALLPPIENGEQRDTIRKYFSALVKDQIKMPEVCRLVSLMALSLRGRSDPALVRILAAKVERPGTGANELCALLLGSGLQKSDLTSLFLAQVAETGMIGKGELADVVRSHAALGLAMAGGADAVPTLLKLVKGKRVGLHTRRGAVIGLGRILESGALSVYLHTLIGIALEQKMVDDPDPLVRGFSVIALGLAKRPFDQKVLMECLTDRGDGTTKPYAALALGLAARRLPRAGADEVREFLIAQLESARGIEIPAALAIAVGLSGATEAADLLARKASDRSLNKSVRGPACQALGLLGGTDPAHEKVLLVALNDKSDEVAQNAALGLGLRGGENAAKLLVKKLSVTRSEMMQAHMVTGLSHLGGAAAIEPLLKLLENTAAKRDIRISAATALGLIITRRERDLLFELDAYTNPYGLTVAGRELAIVY